MQNDIVKVRANKPGHSDGHRRTGEVFEMIFPEVPKSISDFPAWVTPVDWTPGEDSKGTGENDASLATVLAALDHDEDSHWNKDLNPDLNHLREVMGRQVKRDEVDDAAPGLVRVVTSPEDGGE